MESGREQRACEDPEPEGRPCPRCAKERDGHTVAVRKDSVL